MTLEVTSATGRKYQFVESQIFNTIINTYCWYSNKWNRLTKSFHSFEEAQEWIKEMDREYFEVLNAPKKAHTMPASSYYSITGYFGD